MTDITVENYYYSEQLKRSITQFMAVFSGLQVMGGKNNYNSQSNLITVPITFGSKDRVVAAILAENTQNKPIRVPQMSAMLTGLDMAKDRLAGSDQVDREVALPFGGALPNDLKVIERFKPVPYYMRMELGLIASNTSQHLQMLEQILMLFNPILQIQTSDAMYDWTKINVIELDNMTFEENYPSGIDRRLITSTLNFTVQMWIGSPLNIKNNYIKSIHLRIAALTGNSSAQDDLDNNLEEYETLIDVNELDIPAQ